MVAPRRTADESVSDAAFSERAPLKDHQRPTKDSNSLPRGSSISSAGLQSGTAAQPVGSVVQAGSLLDELGCMSCGRLRAEMLQQQETSPSGQVWPVVAACKLQAPQLAEGALCAR